VVIKGTVIQYEVWHWEPLTILLCVVEPGTGLQVDVNDQIEDQLEKPQRLLDVFSRINEADNLGEPQHSEEL
jgi:hypothetical protein